MFSLNTYVILIYIQLSLGNIVTTFLGKDLGKFKIYLVKFGSHLFGKGLPFLLAICSFLWLFNCICLSLPQMLRT